MWCGSARPAFTTSLRTGLGKATSRRRSPWTWPTSRLPSMNSVPPKRWGWDITPGQVRISASILCLAPWTDIGSSPLKDSEPGRLHEGNNKRNGKGDFRGRGRRLSNVTTDFSDGALDRSDVTLDRGKESYLRSDVTLDSSTERWQLPTCRWVGTTT